MAMSRIGKLASDYAGDLIIPLNTLSQGGSKLLATLQLVGGVIITKVLGPLGAVAGVVTGIIYQMKNWEQSAQLVARAMEKAAAKEALTKQFAELTKNVSTAKQKIQDLFQFADKAPFKFENIIKGGEALQKWTKGALLTKDGLALAGNVAAASAQKFDTAAEAIGVFYSDLANGQPVRQSANELRDMGVITQGTVEQIVSLQQAGAGLATTWGIARQALTAHNGAMKGVSQTIEELQGKQDTTKAGILAPAGAIFNEGQKAGLEAQNRLLEKAAPALTQTAQLVARVAVAFGYLKNGVASFIASIPGLSTIIGTLITGFTAFAAAVITVSVGKLAAWAITTANAVRTFGVTATGAAGSAAVEAVANETLAASFRQVVAGATEAAGALRGVQGATLANGAATAGAGAKNAAAAASGMALRGVWRLMGDAIGYLVKGLRILVATPFAAVGSLLAVIAVGAGILVNKYKSAGEAVKDFGDATQKASEQLRQQIDNIQTAADQAEAYQKAIEGAKDAQSSLNDVYKSQSKTGFGWWDGLMDMVNRVPARLKAANDRMDVFKKATMDIKAKTNLAKPDEQNKSELDAQLAAQQAQQDAELKGANPDQQLAILKARADAAEKELKARGQAQKDMAQQAISLTTPQQTAVTSTPAAEQKAIEDARAAEESLKAKMSGNSRPAQLARKQLASDLARATSNLLAAEAMAAKNQAIRNTVQAAQNGAMNVSGSEEMAIMAKLSSPDLAPGDRQQLQNQLALVQQKYGDAGGKRAAVTAKEQELSISGKQTASEQSIANIEAKAAAGLPLTPEEQLQKAQNELPARQKEVEDNPSLTTAQKDLQKQQLQTEIDLQKQDLAYREKIAAEAKRLQSIDQAVIEQDERAVGVAKDHWGAIEAQVRAIQVRSDLTKTEKENAIQLLKINQEQAAVDLYRAQSSRVSNAARIEADAAAMRGDVAHARALRISADAREDDVRQAERVAEITKEGIAAGMNPEDAHQNAVTAAGALRQQDVLQRAMEKRSSLPPVIRGQGGIYGVSQEGLYSDEERDALSAHGISVPGGGPGYSRDSLGNIDPLNPSRGATAHTTDDLLNSVNMQGTGANHHGIDELLGTVGPSAAPLGGQGIPATDPLLKVQQDQLTALNKIAEAVTSDKKKGNVL